MSSPGSKLGNFRIVTYNVLSSHLASPTHFTTLDPLHLEASVRLPRLLKKIEDELSSSTSPTVVCLQEVSYDFAGAFHKFFANQKYTMITGLYGKKFNGYMGVAIAYPLDAMETLDVDIIRLSDKRIGGWPYVPKKDSWTDMAWSYLRHPLEKFGFVNEIEEDHWSMSERRYNVLLTATLKDRESGHSFCIGNYHMPCAYYAPMVMTIHAEMAARRVQDVAKEHENCPYILAGDFNICPTKGTDTEPVYQMLVSGSMDESSACYPSSKNGMDWKCRIEPMRSAYAVASDDGKEPEFTTYARVKENDPFIETLDYIFLSKDWNVKGVKSLPSQEEANGPFPTKDEPSDHILIRADLELE